MEDLGDFFTRIRTKISVFVDGTEQPTQNKSGRTNSQNWPGGQISRNNADIRDGKFEAVVAASAYAVNSYEEDDASLAKGYAPATDLQTSMSKVKGRKEDNLGEQPLGRKASKTTTGEASKNKLEEADEKPKVKIPEKGTVGVVAVRTPTSSEKNAAKMPHVKSGKGMDGLTAKKRLSFKEEREPIAPINKTGNPADVDEWEKDQIAKIEMRYQKLKETIMTWEHKRLAELKLGWEKKQKSLDKKRARGQQEYLHETERIANIAGGARTKAEDRKRNDEAKIREKAEIFRRTGKRPVKYFCF